ncbi:MAG TPA: hypothetical protein VED01_07820 [Burkholderiales bacterium]|nr:hypothetical protein [Burkholderiales bacterium]
MVKRGASAREHYELLAKLVKADGCSSSPDLWFRAACDEHDVHYRTGQDCDGNPITRAEADRRFLARMRECAISPLGRWILAPTYWLFVRACGWRHWRGARALEAPAPAPAPEVSD